MFEKTIEVIFENIILHYIVKIITLIHFDSYIILIHFESPGLHGLHVYKK